MDGCCDTVSEGSQFDGQRGESELSGGLVIDEQVVPVGVAAGAVFPVAGESAKSS